MMNKQENTKITELTFKDGKKYSLIPLNAFPIPRSESNKNGGYKLYVIYMKRVYSITVFPKSYLWEVLPYVLPLFFRTHTRQNLRKINIIRNKNSYKITQTYRNKEYPLDYPLGLITTAKPDKERYYNLVFTHPFAFKITQQLCDKIPQEYKNKFRPNKTIYTINLEDTISIYNYLLYNNLNICPTGLKYKPDFSKYIRELLDNEDYTEKQLFSKLDQIYSDKTKFYEEHISREKISKEIQPSKLDEMYKKVAEYDILKEKYIDLEKQVEYLTKLVAEG